MALLFSVTLIRDVASRGMYYCTFILIPKGKMPMWLTWRIIR